MAINLKKIARDLKSQDSEIRMLALTTVLQLNKQNVEAIFDLPPIYKIVNEIAQESDQDTVFLARKGINHLKDVMQLLNVPVPADVPTLQTAKFQGTKEELVAAIRKETDATKLATLVSQAIEVKDEEVLQLAASFTRHKDSRVRANAVEVIEAQADERRLTLALLPLLVDESHRVRANAARGLGRVGHPRISAFLAEMAQSGKVATREAAIWAVGHLRGEAHVQVLVKALKDPFDPIRLRAVRGLAAHKAESAIGALTSLLNDVDANLAHEAGQAIDAIHGRIPPREALFDLEAMVREGEDRPASGIVGKASPEDLLEATRKKAQEELARIEKILAGEAPKIPRVDIENKSLEELIATRDQHMVYIGQMLTQLCRTGQLNHPEINKLFYDLLKYQELLNRRRELAKAQTETSGSWFAKLSGDATKSSEDLSGSWFSTVRAKLGGQGGDDPVARLEQKIFQLLLQIGNAGMGLLERGEARVHGQEELLRRITAIVAAIEAAKGGTGYHP